MKPFKERYEFSARQKEASRIQVKYPDRVPVIVEKVPTSDIPQIDKCKYLVPKDLTIGQFVYVLRKRIHLTAEKAIFLFIDNSLPAVSSLISQIYRESKDEDGFLYIQYASESTFG